MHSRRQFLAVAVAQISAVAASSLWGHASNRSGAGRSAGRVGVGVLSLDSVNYQTFAQCLGDRFNLGFPDQRPGSVEVRLTKVERSRFAASSGGAEGVEPDARFSLLFESPPGPALRQGIYRLTHERLGTIDLFLVPVWGDGKVVRYEAIFNRG